MSLSEVFNSKFLGILNLEEKVEREKGGEERGAGLAAVVAGFTVGVAGFTAANVNVNDYWHNLFRNLHILIHMQLLLEFGIVSTSWRKSREEGGEERGAGSAAGENPDEDSFKFLFSRSIYKDLHWRSSLVFDFDCKVSTF